MSARRWCSNCGKHVRYWSCGISHGILKARYLAAQKRKRQRKAMQEGK